MKKLGWFLVVLLVSALPALAQEMGGPPMMGMGPPAFLKELFLPGLVMEHQRDIGLTPEQRDAITKEMTATHQKVLQLRWGLEEKSEALQKLLAADRIDEKAALARAAEVMDIEREMKQAHLALLIRLKNELTPEQQQKLAALRPREGRFGRRLFRRGAPEE
jgi:Spy/CpxP family protein refolding chaperone